MEMDEKNMMEQRKALKIKVISQKQDIKITYKSRNKMDKELCMRNPRITLNVNMWAKLKRKNKYYGYKAKEIQTDNGIEFTYNQAEIKKEHPMDTLLNSLNIKHHKIRPRTPEQKVERSHRNDNERFYSWLTFYSLEDLRKQGALRI